MIQVALPALLAFMPLNEDMVAARTRDAGDFFAFTGLRTCETPRECLVDEYVHKINLTIGIAYAAALHEYPCFTCGFLEYRVDCASLRGEFLGKVARDYVLDMPSAENLEVDYSVLTNDFNRSQMITLAAPIACSDDVFFHAYLDEAMYSWHDGYQYYVHQGRGLMVFFPEKYFFFRSGDSGLHLYCLDHADSPDSSWIGNCRRDAMDPYGINKVLVALWSGRGLFRRDGH